jgi:hypothetical protein
MHEHIQNAIGSFGRVLMWDPDDSDATRLLVRARVTSLQEVPQFIVFSVAEGFQGVSWTVQCDIVQQFMLGAQPQDEELVPPYPHNGHQLPVEFFGLGQPVPNFQFDLNIPPIGEIEEDAENVNIAADGWDPWPVQQVQQEQPPAPVPVVEEEQFSYQLSGLEDLPSDESVGLFNDIIIPQAVHFPHEEAQDHEVVVLALPAFPPADPILEGNNEQGEENMNPNVEENIIVGCMLHLEQPTHDPAYEDFMARKRFSSWAELCPPNSDLIPVAKLWAAFFMGLLLRPYSFEWAKKILLSGALSAFIEPNMETVPIKIPSKCLIPPSQELQKDAQSPVPTEVVNRKKRTILVDTEVRSARLREKAKGFKPCFGIKNNCSCCARSSLPSFSHKTLKKLGTEFCNVDPYKLSLDALNSSRSSTAAIQRPRSSSSSRDEPSASSEDQREVSEEEDDAGSRPSAGL